TGLSYDDIASAADGDYEPFYCGEPEDEPSCVPARPDEYDGMSSEEDRDGDGVPNDEDSCPDVFNPPRPLDDGDQPDYDDDGMGDACDECPLNEGEDCEPFDPDDRDGDGIPNDEDNCPSESNPDQEDADDDGIGDACDPCPDYPNEGNTGCPSSTYEVWSGEAGMGDKILLRDVVVTAVNGDEAVFVQHPSDSDDYDGVENSGLYVYMPDYEELPERGDRIDISGTVSEYGGAPQLDTIDDMEVLSSDNELPEPETVDPADVATDGPDADAYRGVLVRVEDVTVTDENPDDPDDFGEFQITGDLRVDDLIYDVDPDEGDTFEALIGPLHESFDNTKLAPRDEDDVVTGPPALEELTPSTAFLKAGATDVPVPGLKVQMTGKAIDAMTIDLSYSDDTVITAPSTVEIPEGEDSAEVELTAASDAADSSTEVTASFDGDSSTSQVTVYDDQSTREVSSLEPSSESIQVDDSATFTANLNLPAAAGGQDLDVSTTGGIDAPDTVTVAEDELSVDFTVDAGSSASDDEEVTVTLGDSSATSDVTVTEGPDVPCLIISEYIEGSGLNNKALELYNCDSGDLDLSDFGLCKATNDSSECDTHANLPSETLAPGEVHTVCKSTSGDDGDPVDDIADNCDTEEGTLINHNGDDRYVVFENTDGSGDFDESDDLITDAFGETSERPSSTPWADQTYRRCDFSYYDGTSEFDVSDYYTSHSQDDASDYGDPPSEGCP
ncbi:MAG: hypothetical protein ACOCV2_01705, partial [Persicimonas sp.]